MGKLITIFLGTSAFAQVDPGGPDVETGRGFNLPNPLGSDNILEILNNILNFLILAAIPLAALMIVFGAYQMMFSGGKPEKFETGQKTIIWTVVAFVIILLAKGITSIIKDILGVS